MTPAQSDATSSPEVRLLIFAVVFAVVCLSCVLDIRCDSFHSSFYTRHPVFLAVFFARHAIVLAVFIVFLLYFCGLFICCFISALSVCLGNLLRFLMGTLSRSQCPVFAGTTGTSSFFLILDQPSASRQLRARNAPEAVA